MFASLKQKFLNVQEEISSSLQNLKFTNVSKTPDEKIVAPDTCNFEAGLELKAYHERQRVELKEKFDANSMKAKEVKEKLLMLQSNYEAQCIKVNDLTNALASIPKLTYGVKEICDLLLNTQCAFEETEDALFQLEDLIETQELRDKQLEHRFQLALYQEKRMSDLDRLKNRLEKERLAKIAEIEKRHEPHAKERQAVFQEAFEEDMKQYKTQGGLTKMRVPTPPTASSLEDIQLEEQNDELESFLADCDESGQQNNNNTKSDTQDTSAEHVSASASEQVT